MTKEELIQKLVDLEWEDFEAKEARSEVPKSSWETVSAFSNTNGGWLLFGIKQAGNNFEIQGVANAEKIEQDFLNTLRGEKFNVFVPTRQEKYEVGNKTVLAFYIPVSKKKPVYYNTLANTFIRRGSSDQRATKEEVDAMYRDQTFGTKTTEPAPGTSRADINDASLSRYRDYMARFNPNVTYNRFNETDFLQKLRILDGEQCTYGGLLFLGKRDTIERFFPDFRIDLLEIPGTSYSDSTIRYTFRLDEYENLWEYYFECVARLKSKVDVEFQLGNEGFAMDFSPGFSALREALVNMLMHADHFSPACPRIRIFTDHIEFYNPGGMPKPLSELKEKDISLPRNPVITKLFRMVKLAENAGYGIEKIDTNWKVYNGTIPAYDISFDSTIVKFYMIEPQTGKYLNIEESGKVEISSLQEIRSHFGILYDRLLLDPDQNTRQLESLKDSFNQLLFSKYKIKAADITDEKSLYIVYLLTLYPELNISQMAQLLGVEEKTIRRRITTLKNNKLLNRSGSKKSGKWEILAHNE